MVVKMLEAVSSLLSECQDVKVVCAKTILDKVIEELKEKDVVSVPIPFVRESRPTQEQKHNQYEVIVDNGRLQEIKNFPLDGKVNLDGVIMTYEEAKGKPFQNASIVEE